MRITINTVAISVNYETIRGYINHKESKRLKRFSVATHHMMFLLKDNTDRSSHIILSKQEARVSNARAQKILPQLPTVFNSTPYIRHRIPRYP